MRCFADKNTCGPEKKHSETFIEDFIGDAPKAGAMLLTVGNPDDNPDGSPNGMRRHLEHSANRGQPPCTLVPVELEPQTYCKLLDWHINNPVTRPPLKMDFSYAIDAHGSSTSQIDFDGTAKSYNCLPRVLDAMLKNRVSIGSLTSTYGAVKLPMHIQEECEHLGLSRRITTDSLDYDQVNLVKTQTRLRKPHFSELEFISLKLDAFLLAFRLASGIALEYRMFPYTGACTKDGGQPKQHMLTVCIRPKQAQIVWKNVPMRGNYLVHEVGIGLHDYFEITGPHIQGLVFRRLEKAKAYVRREMRFR